MRLQLIRALALCLGHGLQLLAHRRGGRRQAQLRVVALRLQAQRQMALRPAGLAALAVCAPVRAAQARKAGQALVPVLVLAQRQSERLAVAQLAPLVCSRPASSACSAGSRHPVPSIPLLQARGRAAPASA